MIFDFPQETRFNFNIDMEDYEQYLALKDRRLYLTSQIADSDSETCGAYMSKTMQLVDDIFAYNRYDSEHGITKRTPIRLYINSPGGDVTEGFSLVSAIKLSKTPIYTINIGTWASMAFLIGITGHKRFSMPNMTFLHHDGIELVYNSGFKAQDQADFNKMFSKEVVKKHVLECSKGKMSEEEYKERAREELYMLPEDALRYGFIDKIVNDINDIL